MKRCMAMASSTRAFSKFELLAVIACVAVLAAILWPVLTPAPNGPIRATCVNNMAQMSCAWVMYNNDNNGNLPLAARFTDSQTNVWALGNAQTVPQDTARYGQIDPGVLDATNLHALTRGALFVYVNESSTYRCPLDKRTVDGIPYVRSYSMNNWMNGQSAAAGTPGLNISNRVYQKTTDIPSPANRFVFIDEDPASVNQTMFTVPIEPGKYLTHIPTRNHGNGVDKHYVMGFADGHVESRLIQCKDTLAWNSSKRQLPEIASDGTTNQDVLKLRSAAYAPIH